MNTSMLRVAGAVLLAALGIWAGTKLYYARGAAQSHHGIPVPAGEASAPNPSDLERAPEGADGMPPPKIPERLPQFSLADRAGKVTSITSFDGKSLIINFWATWCAPCRSEIPLLESLHAEWAGTA